MILNRIYGYVNPLLSASQSGFRRNMSCIEQIHILRRIIEGFSTNKFPLIITFIDFEKAFDSINRVVLWKILKIYGIPEKIIQAIKALYSDQKAVIKLGNQLSDPINILTGVLHGRRLSPPLVFL